MVGLFYAQKLKEIINEDRRVTYQELIIQLKVSEGTLRTLLLRLEVRKICSHFVPKFLSFDLMASRKKML